MAFASDESFESYTADGITNAGNYRFTDASKEDGWSAGKSLGRTDGGTTGNGVQSKLN